MYGCFVVGLVLSVLPPDSAHFDEIEKEFQFILPVCIFCFVSSSNFTMYLDCNLEDDQDKLVCVCFFLERGGLAFTLRSTTIGKMKKRECGEGRYFPRLFLPSPLLNSTIGWWYKV
jgi:hypothetical protein